jgi:hypothetical protein
MVDRNLPRGRFLKNSDMKIKKYPNIKYALSTLLPNKTNKSICISQLLQLDRLLAAKHT